MNEAWPCANKTLFIIIGSGLEEVHAAEFTTPGAGEQDQDWSYWNNSAEPAHWGEPRLPQIKAGCRRSSKPLTLGTHPVSAIQK